MDIPDDPGIPILDTLMIIVMILFVLEMIINGIVDYKTYPWSFFFIMDGVGTVSMIFEISTLLGTGGKMQVATGSVDAMLIRTARAAKVGARVGRLSKLMKCISYYLKDKDKRLEESANPAEAKKLSGRLKVTLSTKAWPDAGTGGVGGARGAQHCSLMGEQVSLLTILLVLAIPLFSIAQYPEQDLDLSMTVYANMLETNYECGGLAKIGVVSRAWLQRAGGRFIEEHHDSVTEMMTFYASGTANYFPYQIDGFAEEVTLPDQREVTIPGTSLLANQASPRQLSDVYRITLVFQIFYPGPGFLYFNFYSPRRIEVALDMGLAAFIILLMIFVSANLNQTLHKLVVQPMESMLSVVKDNASQLLKQFGLEDGMEADEDLEETELLEGIFKKFARLASLAAGRNEATAEELAGMDESARGVMMEMMNVQASAAGTWLFVAGVNLLESESAYSAPTGSEGAEEANQVTALVELPDVPVIASLPVTRDLIESWDLDVLDLDTEGQTKVAIHIFFDSTIGKTTGRYWSEALTFKRFEKVVKAGYNNLPYHNYTHACDVLHTVYRMICLTSARTWLGSVDIYALLVAALCHDIGHHGRTNPFLVELGDELALRYNDKSPLENMHCAKLFEIASNQETDVFKQMDKETKKQARRICIAAILHTDNVNHFEMVREISKIYEMASDLCELQASQPDLLPQYTEQVMQKNALQWMELFLHFADVSNPLKPFPAGASGLPSNLENEFRYTYIIMYIYIYMLPPKKNQRFQTNFLLVCM
ncbi:5'-cyclic phosphodiesterase 8A (MmPDE8) [Durusdinium trenchii]|uniref:Phosphodiesterase n=1 Tax=Durusdinium trenchii TaxID=1381693 RepID=A0ABP0MP21_9DINO